MTRVLWPLILLTTAGCTPSRDAPILMETPGHTGIVTAAAGVSPEERCRQASPAPVETPAGLSLEDQCRAAVRDLIGRLNVSVDRVQIASSAYVDWASSALGCPQPGRMYLTALMPGVEIVIAVEGSHYHYHAASLAEPFLCPDERREPPARTRPSR